jgi:hypothetical protein
MHVLESVHVSVMCVTHNIHMPSGPGGGFWRSILLDGLLLFVFDGE